MSTTVVDPCYPIGKFQRPESITPQMRCAAISDIATMPEKLAAALHGLTPEQLNTPYREGGWTVRQVVHHLADSHMNAVVRIKMGLTEETPTIKLYDEKGWAKLADSEAPLDWSLTLVTVLHTRWVYLLNALDERQWASEFFHPAQNRTVSIDAVTQMYAWHSKHHVAHITRLRENKGW